MNVYAMLADAVRRRRDATAVRWGEIRLSYRAFDGICAVLGDWLAENGCMRGERMLGPSAFAERQHA